MIVGYLDRSAQATPRYGRPPGAPQNAAAVLHRGEVALSFAKHHLPNYGVFDEFRYFVPGDTLPVVRVHGVDVALAICEDLWQDGGRVPATRSAGAGLLVSVNASPYERDKDDTRLELVRKRAQEAGCTTAYLAMIGGQDELVFDGDSIVVGKDGSVIARAPQFAEGCVLVDLDLPAAAPVPPSGVLDDGLRVDHLTLTPDPLPPYPPEPLGGVAERLDGPGGDLHRAGRGPARVCRQERLPQRGARPLRRDRLGAGRRARLRRAGRGARPRRRDAVPLFVGALAHRRRRTRAPYGPVLPYGADRPDVRRLHGGAAR